MNRPKFTLGASVDLDEQFEEAFDYFRVLTNDIDEAIVESIKIPTDIATVEYLALKECYTRKHFATTLIGRKKNPGQESARQ